MPAQVLIDGTDVTGYTIVGSATRRLNRPSQATVTVPIQNAVGDVGSRLKILFNGTLFHHGMIQMIEDSADENTGYTQYNSTDPMEILLWRPVRDGDDSPTPGNLITPSVLTRKQFGGPIMEEILGASISTGAGPPTASEGPLFMALGSFATGGPDVSGAPCTWPMTIADLISLLTSTGALDVILTPIDSGGNMAVVDTYNGDYGNDLSGSVIFDFATGSRNVRNIRQSVDLSNSVNKLQYFAGPKLTTERYQWNITGDDPCLNDPSAYNQAAIAARRTASQGSYGVRMEIQEFDVDVPFNEKDYSGGVPPFPNFCVGGVYSKQDPTRYLYRRLWQLESWIRAVPRTLVHVTPTRETEIGSFDIGDIVGVNAGSEFRGGFSGAQRIYEYTISWDNDGVLALGELQTSSDQEGL
jgi:hypothetical protein